MKFYTGVDAAFFHKCSRNFGSLKDLPLLVVKKLLPGFRKYY